MDLSSLSDEEFRSFIRQMFEMWLRKLNMDGDVELKMQNKFKFIQKLKHQPIAIQTHEANQQHYEVPTSFFLTVLGPRLKYSCCLWSEGLQQDGLAAAENAMLELTCRRAKIDNSGLSVLDLGCGWGSFSFYICEKFPSSSVVAVSNSSTQRAFIEETARRKGYTNLRVITADVNDFDPLATKNTTLPIKNWVFDRIVSIEMFEHMKNYELLLSRIATWLRPDGFLFVQILCHREFAYPFVTKTGGETEWMAKHFFSGGTMPSDDLLLYFQNDAVVVDHWRLNGKHYSKTLEAWLAKQDENSAKVVEIFGGGEEGKKQSKLWRMFFMYCSESFAYNNGNDWIVSQYLFAPRNSQKSRL